MVTYDLDRDGALSLKEFMTLYHQNKNEFSNVWSNLCFNLFYLELNHKYSAFFNFNMIMLIKFRQYNVDSLNTCLLLGLIVFDIFTILLKISCSETYEL